MATPISAVDFIAYALYATASAEINEVPVRWLCLREDLKGQYLKVATETLEAFVIEEQDAEKRRDASASKFAALTVEVPSDSDK